MMRILVRNRSLVVCAAALVAACGTASPTINRYDFGVPPATATGATQAGAAGPEITVNAPVWLETPSVLYRLGYADESQLRAYAQIQWVSAPSRLVEQALLAASAGTAPPACKNGAAATTRIDVSLQEFSQDFDDPHTSHVVLRARVRALAAHAHTVVAQRQFDLRSATATPDGPGAVHGLRDLARTFAAAAVAWAGSCAPDISATEPQR